MQRSEVKSREAEAGRAEASLITERASSRPVPECGRGSGALVLLLLAECIHLEAELHDGEM